MSLFLRNLFFTLIHPGIVAGLIPYWLLRQSHLSLSFYLNIRSIAGVGFMILGFGIMAYCIFHFGRYGRGTLSPADKTQYLVLSGLYRYSRNPMYIGVLLILVGEALAVGTWILVFYTLLVFALFNFFILVIEEPRLKRDFGKPYLDYCQRVRRWL